jgi:ubiquinone/menaquinone biosynthesis C-methylase UbiE
VKVAGRRPADFDRMASSYDRGRSLPPEALGTWREAMAAFVPEERHVVVLDLGAGTGLFSHSIAHWFNVRVVALEPSEGMRREARRKPADPRVAFVGARGEWIPLRDGTCDAAWVSNVIDHIQNLVRCAQELRRVLRPPGRILIRDAFADHLENVSLFRYFPEAREFAQATGRRLEETIEVFAEAGFQLEALRQVEQRSAPNLAAFHDRVRSRAFSVLQAISDEAFARGLEELRAEASSASATDPVVSRLDFVVLRAAI